MTIVREGRKTCRYCRKPLGNGEPLTDATVEVTERWSTNSVGFVRVPVAAHHVPMAAHAACHDESLRWFRESTLRNARENLAEIDELIAEREAAGRPLGTLPDTRAKFAAIIADLETA